MKQRIGNKIAEQRKQLKLTQKQLAIALGVNPQTISKWERGQQVPAVSYLASLANALHTSVDELLGYYKRREELNAVWLKEFSRGNNPRESLAFCEKVLEEYPLDKTFLFCAMLDEERIADSQEEEQDKTAYLLRAMGYAKRLENLDKERVKETLVRIYSKLGWDEKAGELAQQCQNSNLALKYCLKGEELLLHKQRLVDKKFKDFLWELIQLDRRLELLDIAEGMIHKMFPDGNYQHYCCELDGIYCRRAELYMKEGEKDKVVQALRDCFELDRQTESIQKTQRFFTSPALNLIENKAKYIGMSPVEEFYFLLQKDAFGFHSELKDNEEYIKLLEDMSVYLGEDKVKKVTTL